MLTALLSTEGMSPEAYTAYITLTFVFMAILLVAAIVAIIVVLFQKSNSDGIQGITATSETFFGKNKGRSIESKLKKWTWISLVVIGVLSVVIYIVQIMLA